MQINPKASLGVFVCFAFLSLSSLVFSDDNKLRGQLKCKITDFVSLLILDGKPERYNGSKEHLGKGDWVKLDYYLYTGLSERHNGGLALQFMLSNSHLAAEFHYRDMKREGESVSFNEIDLGTNLDISNDKILYQWSSATLVLHRYYKEDWHGIYNTTYDEGLASETWALDCRTKQNTIGEVVDKIKTLDILDLLGIGPPK